MAELRIGLLGAPQVEVDGAALRVDTRKAIALLAYLAVVEGPQSRDSLAALLWPDYDGENARSSLRRTLSTLRKALSDRWLIAARDTLVLTGDRWQDTRMVEALLARCSGHGHNDSEVCERCIEPLSEAAALFRGDFMAGFGLRDSLEYEEWQSFQSESFRRVLAGLLQRLVRACSAAGRYEDAVGYARRWLATDPLQESAHCAIMQLYALDGDRSAALRQYRECVRVLSEELGVPPLESTTQLYQSILDGQAIGTAPNQVPGLPPAVSATVAPVVPMVGREGEMARLRAMPVGRVVVLEGEAGIGKTRLARELLDEATAMGDTVLVARCYEGETELAFAPIMSLLRSLGSGEHLSLVPDPALSEASRLLPELLGQRPGLAPPPALDSPGAQTRFYDGLIETALASRQAGRLIVLIEDVHWADEASLDLLAYLSRRLAARPVLILLTWRSEAVPPDHRLRHLIAEAEREGRGTLIQLQPLSVEAVAELVRLRTPDGATASGLASRLHQESGGNPFVLMQYLEAGVAQSEGDTVPLPPGVRDLLLARLSRVSEAAAQLLTTAAVLGRSFPYELLREVSGRSEEETVSSLEELAARSLIVELVGSGSELGYDFSHERLRSLVYEGASLARRRLLHRRAAEALERTSGRRLDAAASQIAYHYRLAGSDEAAARHFKLAAEHARLLSANGEALAHFRAALALGHPAACELQEEIGTLLMLSGAYGGALTSLQTAAALAESERLPAIEHRIGGIYLRLGAWSLAEEHFAAALAGYGDTAAGARARVHADRSLAAHHQAKVDEAQDEAEQALALAALAADDLALAQAHNILGVLASSRGDLAMAMEHLEKSLAQAELLAEPSACIAAMNNLALVVCERGDLARAETLTLAALTLCSRQGDRHREAALHNNRADLFRRAGRTAESMESLKQAVAIFAEIGADMGSLEPEVWKLVEW